MQNEDPSPTAGGALPEMLGAAPPEHDVRGRIIILLIQAGAVGVFLMALSTWWNDPYPAGEYVVLVVLGAMGSVALLYLAEGFRRFRCWAWFFVGWWLGFPVLFGLLSLLFAPRSSLGDIAEFAVFLMLAGGLQYLWQRRWDFWMDARLQARLSVPRRVSDEWRRARRAGLAASAHAGRSHAALTRAGENG